MTLPAESEALEERWGPRDPDKYRIDTLAAADFAARKVQEIKTRITETTLQYDEIIAEWQQAKEDAVRKVAHDLDLYLFNLKLFLQHQVEDQGPDADPAAPVTIKLPCGGELAYRPNPSAAPRLVVEDKEKVLEWATDRGAVTFTADSAAVKEALLAGSAVPGAHLEPPKHEVWQIKVGK
jgi:hypothetical protein